MRASCVIIFILILHLFSVASVKPHDDKGIIYGDEKNIKEGGESTEPLEYEIPCGISNVSNLMSERIVGGETAKHYEFPWIVSVQLFDKGDDEYKHNCGGSIIHSLYILTAAHCTYDHGIDALLIQAGKLKLSTQEDHEQTRGVVEVIYNDYVHKTLKNDIALIKLNASLKLEPYFVGPICLSEGNVEFKEKEVVAGWGRLKENGSFSIDLQKVTLDMIDNNTCRKKYENTKLSGNLHDCQICTLTDNKDTCQADSGGPLMSVNKADDKIVYINGIVSWSEGCAQKNHPAVYTQVACFIKWIKNNIAKETKT